MPNRIPLGVLVGSRPGFSRVVLTRLINDSPAVGQVWQGSSQIEILDLCRQHHPSVIILDVASPGLVNLVLNPQLRKASTAQHFILLGSSDMLAPLRERFSPGEDSIHFVPRRGASAPSLEEASDHLLGLLANLQGTGRSAPPPPRPPRLRTPEWLIAIGASTGGTNAIEHLLAHLAPQLPAAILIAQHIHGAVSRNFAQRLHRTTAWAVHHAEDNEGIGAGQAYIAPGGHDLRIRLGPNGMPLCMVTPSTDLYNSPSINNLMHSAAMHWPGRTIGVLLSGLGNDGAQGVVKLRERGGITLGQDAESSLVFGLAKAADAAGGIQHLANLDQLANILTDIILKKNGH